MGDKAPVSTDWEHATGLELKELQAAAEGKDFFDHYDFLKQPNGTKESPVVTAVPCGWWVRPTQTTIPSSTGGAWRLASPGEDRQRVVRAQG